MNVRRKLLYANCTILNSEGMAYAFAHYSINAHSLVLVQMREYAFNAHLAESHQVPSESTSIHVYNIIMWTGILTACTLTDDP